MRDEHERLGEAAVKRRRWPAFVVVGAFVASLALGSHAFARSAPPLARSVPLIETSPQVTDVVGSPASVSLAMTRRLRRNALQALIAGEDSLSLLTTVKGPKGEAEVRLDARNLDHQGWAGTFSVVAAGRRVLKDGQYVSDGAGILLEGDFAPDGTPRVNLK